jgi:branched-chain amino acid transport system permease protein
MKKLFGILIILSIVALLPLLGIDRYYMRFFTYLFMWIALSGCWNISSGYTGYIDFGPVVYFGIGSYVTAVSMTMLNIPFFLSVVLAGIIALVISLIMGMPTLKLKGAYFAIATFAFAESMKQIILSFDRTFHIKFFMGSHGITVPISNNYRMFYYLMLFMAGIVVVTTFFVEKTRFGLALKAINESEQASEMIGIDTTMIKLSAYMISAFFISIIGGIYAYWVTYITPDDVFNVHKTVQMVIMSLLGGMGTLIGPVLGATFLSTVSEYLGAEFVENYLIIVGIIVVLVILIEPSGLYGLKKWKKFLKQTK